MEDGFWVLSVVLGVKRPLKDYPNKHTHLSSDKHHLWILGSGTLVLPIRYYKLPPGTEGYFSVPWQEPRLRGVWKKDWRPPSGTRREPFISDEGSTCSPKYGANGVTWGGSSRAVVLTGLLRYRVGPRAIPRGWRDSVLSGPAGPRTRVSMGVVQPVGSCTSRVQYLRSVRWLRTEEGHRSRGGRRLSTVLSKPLARGLRAPTQSPTSPSPAPEGERRWVPPSVSDGPDPSLPRLAARPRSIAPEMKRGVRRFVEDRRSGRRRGSPEGPTHVWAAPWTGPRLELRWGPRPWGWGRLGSGPGLVDPTRPRALPQNLMKI